MKYYQNIELGCHSSCISIYHVTTRPIVANKSLRKAVSCPTNSVIMSIAIQSLKA